MSGQFARLNESLHRAHPTTLNQRIEVFASDLHAILDHYLITQNQAANDLLLLRQALAALETSRDYAFETAEQFHIEMRGYKQQRHDAMDADVKRIDDTIAALKERLT